MSDLVEVLGKKTVTLKLGEEEFVLAPLTLNDLAEFEVQVGDLGNPYIRDSLRAIRYELWASAKNGGYTGSMEELAAKVAPEDVSIVRARLSELYPKTHLQRALTLLLEGLGALQEGKYPGLAEQVTALSEGVAEAVKAEQGDDEGNAFPASSETGPDKPGV